MEVPRSPEVGEQLPVQVLLRLRPLTGQRETIVVHQGPRSIKICNPVQSMSANGELLLVSKRSEYTFDWVLPETSSQVDTFRKSCPSMLRHFLQGGNALLFCYGPSASGKTFTIVGDDKNPGILPNILRSVFASIEVAKSANLKQTAPSGKSLGDASIFPLLPGMEYNVWVSYLECYNERIYDLLKTSKGASTAVPLDIKYTKTHVPIIPSHEPTVNDSQQAMQWLAMGQGNRQIGSTQINKTSSRSHTIFTIKLTQTPIGATQEDIKADPSLVRYSKFSIVDLAGSERSTKSQASGERLREASNINNSLLTLKRCMKALQQNQIAAQLNAAGVPILAPVVTESAQKRLSSANRRTSTDKGLGSTTTTARPMEVVPFRDSTLTKLLREFLQGEGKCSVIVNINPASAEYDESLQALDFGTITKAVKTTTCKKKVVARSASPPQPIPFSLPQIGGTATTTTTGRTVARKPSQLSAAAVALNLEKLASQPFSLNLSASMNNSTNTSLNQSLNQSLNLNQSLSELNAAKPKPVYHRPGSNMHTTATVKPVPSTHTLVSEVEVSSPSKSILNRSRALNGSVAMSPRSRDGFQVASQLRFDDMVLNGPFELEHGLEVDDLEVSAYDELELATEVNKLRVALLEAETRVIEAEMAVRSELAQEMANRILEMDCFYRAQSETRIRNTQDKYEKLLDHYHKAYAEEQEMAMAALERARADANQEASNGEMSDVEDEEKAVEEKVVEEKEEKKVLEEEEELESRESLLARMSEKDAEIEATQGRLASLRAEMAELSTKYQRSQEAHRHALRGLQDQHGEEVSILRTQLDLVQKEVDAVKREWETVRNSPSDLMLAMMPDTPALVETMEVSPKIEMEVAEAPAPKKKRGRPRKEPEIETPDISESLEVAAVVEADEEIVEIVNPVGSKKRRGRTEVVPKSRAKTSKLKENTTPSATAAAEADPMPEEDPIEEVVEVQPEVVEVALGRPKRGKPIRAKTSAPAQIKRTKAVKTLVVEDFVEMKEVEAPIEAEESHTPLKAAPKFGAVGRKLASPSSPHLIVSPVAKAGKKIKVIDEEDYEPENAPDSNRLPSRTPMQKRLRSRRPTEVLDSDAEDFASPLRKAPVVSAAGGKRRGAAAAPRYLSQFM